MADIVFPYTFSPNTLIESAKVNANFNQVAINAFNKFTGDTCQGPAIFDDSLTGIHIRTVSTITTTYTATTADDILLCNGSFTVTVFAVAGNTGRTLTIKNIGSGSIRLAVPDGATGISPTPLDVNVVVRLVTDGSSWFEI